MQYNTLPWTTLAVTSVLSCFLMVLFVRRRVNRLYTDEKPSLEQHRKAIIICENSKASASSDEEQKRFELKLQGLKDNEKAIKAKIIYTLYEITFSVGAWAFFILAASIVTNKFLKFQKIKGSGGATLTEFALTQIDAAGIILGIVGILVGLLIFAVVEKGDEKKREKLEHQLKDLSIATQKIDENNLNEKESLFRLEEAISTIGSHISSVVPVSTHEERLLRINEIIKHSVEKSRSNELYILSYAPNYGQFLLHNLNILLSENGLDVASLQRLSQRAVYKNILEKYEALRDKNYDSLVESFNGRNCTRLKLAVLKTSSYGVPNVPKRFENFIMKKILNNIELIEIDEHNDSLFIDVPKSADISRCFVYTSEEYNTLKNPQSKQSEFLTKLFNKDKQMLRALKTAGVSPKYLDYIPFQFFISVSPDPQSKKCAGLIIFTNYYNIGDPSSVVSFYTENHILCNSLKKMFEGLVQTQEQKDSGDFPFKDLFTKGNQQKLKFILKNVPIFEDNKMKVEVTPISDITAKDSLLHLFAKNKVDFTTSVEYVRKDVQFSFGSFAESVDFSFVSIGLFHNAVSEVVGGFPEPNSEHTGVLFRMSQSGTKNLEGTFPKCIQIAVSGNTNTGATYSKEFYRDDDINKDIILVSKQKIKNRWVWICGGLNTLGTENLISCFSDQFSLTLHMNSKPDLQFAALFLYNKNAENSTNLHMLSVLDQTGNVQIKI